VKVIHSSDWEAGQNTSVRAGIRVLPAQTTAAIFLLGDQPFVSVELLHALQKNYVQNRPTILAPFVECKRSNPVLFEHSVFETLCALQGDAGARIIFAQYPQPYWFGPKKNFFLMSILLKIINIWSKSIRDLCLDILYSPLPILKYSFNHPIEIKINLKSKHPGKYF
jgi:hypothetical protein